MRTINRRKETVVTTDISAMFLSLGPNLEASVQNTIRHSTVMPTPYHLSNAIDVGMLEMQKILYI